MKENTYYFLIELARALSEQFGSNCEIVIHDLVKNPMESSIVYIENGHLTNRKIGDGPSLVVLESMKKNSEQLENRVGYLTKSPDGKIFKSSTIYIKDDDWTVIGIFGINYEISTMMMFENTLSDFLSIKYKKEPQFIPHDVNSLLDNLMEYSVKCVGKPVSLMNREDKIKAIQYLYDSGAFLITKAGDKISEYFGISKYTLYNYIEKNEN